MFFCILYFRLACNPRFKELVSKVKTINLFKDGYNVPLSLATTAGFLVWVLVLLSYLYFLWWSGILLYCKFTYQSFLLIVLLVLFTWLIALDFFPENLIVLIYQNVPRKPLRLPLQLFTVAVGLAWVLHLLFTYLAQRDYWSLLFLALLGISLEYNYCLKDHLLLAVNPGAVIRGPLVGGTYQGRVASKSVRRRI